MGKWPVIAAGLGLTVLGLTLAISIGNCVRGQSAPRATWPTSTNPAVPPKVLSAVRKQLQEQVTDRQKRRAAAAREAAVLLQQADSATASEEQTLLRFQAGLLYLTAQRWPAAKEVFESIRDGSPDSIWAQESRVCLCDLALEIDLDPAAAEAAQAGAEDWADFAAPEPPPRGPHAIPLIEGVGIPGRELPLQRPGPVFDEPEQGQPLSARREGFVAADVQLRRGLLHWMSGEKDSAKLYFRRAFRLNPAPRSSLTALALAVWQDQQFALTPTEAQAGKTPEIGRLIVYGDVLQGSLQTYRVHDLWSALLSKRSRDITPLQRSYVLYRRGHARSQFLNRLEREPDTVLRDYEQSRKAAPKAPWDDHNLLLAGNVAWNFQRDGQASVALWRQLVAEHSESPHAPRAAYYIGVAYEKSSQWELAYLAYASARDLYPDAANAHLIEKHLQTVKVRLGGKAPALPAAAQK